MKKKILVIGASGVVGQAAIAAVRQVYSHGAYIVATTTSYKPIPLANEIMIIKLSSEVINDSSWLESPLSSGPFDITFFTPAYASGIGKPLNEVTLDEKNEGFNYCVKPLIQLDDAGAFGTLVAFSSFLDLPLVSKVYGAMVYSKKQLEDFCAADIFRRQLFRLGAFESKLLRGLAAKILLHWRGRVQQMCKELFSKNLNPEQKKFSQALLEEIIEQEKKYFGSTELTTPEKIRNAVAQWLRERTPGFYNLVGDVFWIERKYSEKIIFTPILSLEEKKLLELHRCFMPAVY